MASDQSRRMRPLAQSERGPRHLSGRTARLCCRLTMMEKSSSQYDSFLFWRQPIPALDLSELREVGLLDGPRNQARDELIGRDRHVSGRD